jgi:hypothetical protein
MKTSSSAQVLGVFRKFFDVMKIIYPETGDSVFDDFTECCLRAVKRRLKGNPEPEPRELKELSQIHDEVMYLMRKDLPIVAKRLPHPPGGRPQALNSKESQDACQEVGNLILAGMNAVDAIKRVATRWEVSTRTMRRVWNMRAALLGKSSQKRVRVGGARQSSTR